MTPGIVYSAQSKERHTDSGHRLPEDNEKNMPDNVGMEVFCDKNEHRVATKMSY